MTPKSKNGGPHENAHGSAANQRQQQQLHMQNAEAPRPALVLPGRLLSLSRVLLLGLLELFLGLLFSFVSASCSFRLGVA